MRKAERDQAALQRGFDALIEERMEGLQRGGRLPKAAPRLE